MPALPLALWVIRQLRYGRSLFARAKAPGGHPRACSGRNPRASSPVLEDVRKFQRSMHSNLDAFGALAMVVVHVFYDIGVSSKSRRDHSRTLTTATVVEIYLLEKVSSDWTRPRAWTRSMRLRVHRGLVFAVSTRKFR